MAMEKDEILEDIIFWTRHHNLPQRKGSSERYNGKELIERYDLTFKLLYHLPHELSSKINFPPRPFPPSESSYEEKMLFAVEAYILASDLYEFEERLLEKMGVESPTLNREGKGQDILLIELQQTLEEKDTRIAELEKELAATIAEPATTVNAAKWENSVKAVFGVWSEIIQGDRADWIEDEFRAALAKRCRDYHTKVHALGWGLLPDDFKNGRGRPKKNPEKSQQSDNS